MALSADANRKTGALHCPRNLHSYVLEEIMEIHWIIYIGSLVVAGLGSGFISGLFGVGGGIVRIPIFLFMFPFFGVGQDILMHLAVGTSLSLAIPSAVMASRAQYRAGNLDFGFLRTWVPGLLAGVFAGIIIMRFTSSRFLEAVFAVVIVLAAIHMLFFTERLHIGKQVPVGLRKSLLSFPIGTVSMMMGISGGTLTTPLLTAYNYPIHRCIALATAGGLFISVTGTIGSLINGLGVTGLPKFSLGYIDLTAVVIMLPTVMFSAPWGVRLANRLSQKKLKKIFAVFLVIVAVQMVRNLI